MRSVFACAVGIVWLIFAIAGVADGGSRISVATGLILSGVWLAASMVMDEIRRTRR